MAISDLETPTRSTHGPTCSVCATLATLPEDEAAALRGLLANPAWQYTRLSDALKGEGIELAPHVLGNHARGRCAARERLR